MTETFRRRTERDPIVGVSIILVGSLLMFYLVGFVLVPLGILLLPRRPSLHPPVLK